MKKLINTFFLFLFLSGAAQEKVIIIADQSYPRLKFGAEKLAEILKSGGYIVNVSGVEKSAASADRIILISVDKEPNSSDNHYNPVKKNKNFNSGEGFRLSSDEKKILITGSGATGALYGALELAKRVEESGRLPSDITFEDRPEMVLRGAAIGLQKTSLLPGRGVYEYPYTPENFPWFYNKELWVKYLDMLVENRYNSLYLWNGHPFASLIKLKDYPYAVEVDEETFKKNEEIFNFLTTEADKRGIWVIQMFYNVIVSKPFAEHHNIETQNRTREITPLLKDYTRKSIAAFIEKYPNVGLLVALGEAMSGIENDIDLFTNTIIPGVKDGLLALGETEEPPIILRAHDTDAPVVIDKTLPFYKNLYTMHKYNGESLTTYEPRGPWTEIHQDLGSLGSIHISNVHVLANLEPFRYGSPNFIRKSVIAMHNVHKANALHLFPQASYWDWPYSADKTDERLLQMERDWIWYEAWGRYAWASDREVSEEKKYWSKKLAEKFGTSEEAGSKILKAYDEAGEIAPKTLRRFGITEGNRQTLLLGMFMSQLVNPYKWRVYPGFYESTGPEGEILIEFAEREWNGLPHKGETPPQIIAEIATHGKLAAEAIEEASAEVSKQKEEFDMLKNDIQSYKFFADFFAEKVKAALLVLQYEYSGDISDLKKALSHLEKSVAHYEMLVELTSDTYLYANSMQTGQRRIPIGGNDGDYKHWMELLPRYREELNNFKDNIRSIENARDGVIKKKIPGAWKPAKVELSNQYQVYPLGIGKLVYDRMDAQVLKIAPELRNLQWLKFSEKEQINEGTHFKFKNSIPVKLVVGFFDTDEDDYLTPTTLETNAAGNTRGQADVVLANALQLDDYPKINIHTYTFEEGENEITLGKGRVLLLGFIDADQEIKSRDAGIGNEGEKEAIDWLFY